MNKLLTLFTGLLLITSSGLAQVKIGDNLTTVNANSILELESTTKALLLPRLTQTQIDAMQNVPAGMLVYNSTANVLNIRTSSGWTTLALAANAASATNPWSTTNTTIYATNTNSRVGIGTSTPFSQLANTSLNTVGSNGYGGNPGSLSWAANQFGYVGQLYNAGNDGSSNGLAVKVFNGNATALDVSQGAQNTSGSPLLHVRSNGRVGINTNDPSEALEVNGNIKYSGNLQMGVQYVFTDNSIPASSLGLPTAGCPSGTKLIGGGGGQLNPDANTYNFSINYSGPNKDNNNVWVVVGKNLNSTAVVMRVYAICAKVQ